MPFSREEFFGVFASYNSAVWPAQLLLYLLAVAIIVFVVGGSSRSRRAAALGLASLWAWVGISYHWAHFTAINPAAWAFGALFVMQGGLLLAHGIRGRLEAVEAPRGWRGWIGGALLLYALIAYPLLGLAGHPALEVPVLGVPCPTTIYTVGIFFLWAGPSPRRLLVIPLLWAFFGSSAVVLLGVVQDVGLFVTGLAGLLLLRRASCTGIEVLRS